MGVEIDVDYSGDLHCVATHGPSGNTLVTDAPVDNGGRGAAFSPTDLVATGLGTCVLTIMGLVAKRNNLDIAGARVHVTKEMAAGPVRRIGTLKATVTLPAGRNFSPADRKRLENGAAACPVRQSLHPDVNIVLEFVYPPVILRLVVAVVPDPRAVVRDAARVLRAGGRPSSTSLAAPPDGRLGSPRLTLRLINPVVRVLATAVTRQLGPIAAGSGLRITSDQPAGLRGLLRIVQLIKD